MPTLNVLRPDTRSFQDVVGQALNNGASIVRDLTADPWRYFGTYLTFDYAAKTNKPYDRYPLMMFADYNPDTRTLMGYNFHHLPIHRRLWLMESMSGNLAALMKGWRGEHENKEEDDKQMAKIVSNFLRKIVSWKEMGQYYSACTRQYNVQNVKSEFIAINSGSELLNDMMVVPYEKIYNGTRREILEKSKAVFMKEAKR
tara:strand:+ start:77 stop:676 length:600 start_codon:yes stop_codon:yes gene_type:complete